MWLFIAFLQSTWVARVELLGQCGRISARDSTRRPKLTFKAGVPGDKTARMAGKKMSKGLFSVIGSCYRRRG
ncbi:hypothetical protein F5B21DRAFT_137494 [Xylaria acuta]|nr:hypothetical protein F5B21DRAFT_137494 [Xylaria acuta]